MKDYIRKNKSLFTSSCKQGVVTTITSPKSVVSPNIESLYKCKICGKSFTRRSHLHRHQKFVHEKKMKKMVKCNICRVELNVENLTRHIQTKHEANSFKCQDCPKTFNRKCNLLRHINSVHKRLTMQKCRVCTKLYSDEYKLKDHKCNGSMKDKNTNTFAYKLKKNNT